MADQRLGPWRPGGTAPPAQLEPAQQAPIATQRSCLSCGDAWLNTQRTAEEDVLLGPICTVKVALYQLVSGHRSSGWLPIQRRAASSGATTCSQATWRAYQSSRVANRARGSE